MSLDEYEERGGRIIDKNKCSGDKIYKKIEINIKTKPITKKHSTLKTNNQKVFVSQISFFSHFSWIFVHFLRLSIFGHLSQGLIFGHFQHSLIFGHFQHGLILGHSQHCLIF